MVDLPADATELPADTIYFDGGCSPNPGPIIVAVVCRDHALLRDLERITGGNNEAEFRAAAAALDHAAKIGMRRPVIAGDSDAVIGALAGRAAAQAGPVDAILRGLRRQRRRPRGRYLAACLARQCGGWANCGGAPGPKGGAQGCSRWSTSRLLIGRQ